MLRKARQVIIVSALLAIGVVQAAADPQSLDGYGNSRWGMTPEQVLKAEAPLAKMLEPPAQYRTGVGLVGIDEIQVITTKMGVMFIFDDPGRKLKQVNLTSLESKNALLNAHAFSSLEKILTEKYGAPTYKQDGRNVSWKLPKTTIDLNHMNISGVVSRVTVVYKPTSASASDSSNL